MTDQNWRRQRSRRYLVFCLLAGALFLCSNLHAQTPQLELTVDTSQSHGSIDLTRYALGQGGFSYEPMIDGVIPQITQLHPQTIRIFIMEYFNIYPGHNQYSWERLDKALQAIRATGARPIMCLCLKPKVLYPKVDQKVVFPSSWPEWESLMEHLVRHCNDSKLDVAYWEVGNEGNIGEAGGGPYLFQPQDYLTYYTHTVNAIRRADVHAKVGGPTLATWKPGPLLGEDDPILTALVDYCGKGHAPLDFVSWHLYSNDPKDFRQEVREVRTMLAKYDTLKNVETVLDEWNMALGGAVMNPYFQSAFVLETTYGFYEEGLSRSGYYHIRDILFDPKLFTFLSEPTVTSTAHIFNDLPIYLGLYDTEGRVRPTYYALKTLSQMKGEKLAIAGAGPDVKGFAVRNSGSVRMLFWNFPDAEPMTYEVSVRFPHEKAGNVRLFRLDAESAVNNWKIVSTGGLADPKPVPLHATMKPYEVYWVELQPE